MKRILLGLCCALLAVPAFADTYSVTFGFVDTTTYLPDETPAFAARYRVNAGAETVIPGLPTPGGSFSVTAIPGQPIEVSARTCVAALCSDWSGWVTATAQHPPTVPNVPTNLTITVVRTGP